MSKRTPPVDGTEKARTSQPHGEPVHANPLAWALQPPEQLSWFLLLLPGFVLVSVMGVVTERPEWSEIEFTAYSLIGSVFCFGLTVPMYFLARTAGDRWRRALKRSVRTGAFGLPAAFVALNFMLAALVGGALGIALEHDASINSLNRALGVKLDKKSWMRPLKYVLQSNHFGRLKEMEVDGRSPALAQRKAYVRLTFKEGPIYEGWPYLLPHGNAVTEVYLSPACRQREKTAAFDLVQGPGVVLSLDEYQSIELVDRAASSCFAAVKAQASCKACGACVQEAAAGNSNLEKSSCKQCSSEAEALAMSTLIDVSSRQGARMASEACSKYVECGDVAHNAACHAKQRSCSAAAAAVAASAPGC